jgi:hypothetical protein
MMTPAQRRRRVDLALVTSEDLLVSALPALGPDFKFDAFLEFGYLSDSGKCPGVVLFGDPVAGRKKVRADVEKIGLHKSPLSPRQARKALSACHGGGRSFESRGSRS